MATVLVAKPNERRKNWAIKLLPAAFTCVSMWKSASKSWARVWFQMEMNGLPSNVRDTQRNVKFNVSRLQTIRSAEGFGTQSNYVWNEKEIVRVCAPKQKGTSFRWNARITCNYCYISFTPFPGAHLSWQRVKWTFSNFCVKSMPISKLRNGAQILNIFYSLSSSHSPKCDVLFFSSHTHRQSNASLIWMKKKDRKKPVCESGMKGARKKMYKHMYCIPANLLLQRSCDCFFP